MAAATTPRNIVPGAADRVFNAVVARMTRMGISLMGSRVLAVRGRSSGQWRTVPVNLLSIDGERYLVAPRGHTQWVRNVRAAGGGELRLGREVEAFAVEELADADKPVILREYLRKWAWEVGRFFDGVDKGSSDAQLLAIAPGFPVFRLTRP
jgi:deazaflavin-dependent oxidoreductase (nitroreductase family)